MLCHKCHLDKPNVGRWRLPGKPVAMWCGGCKLDHWLADRKQVDKLQNDLSQATGLNVTIETPTIH